MKSIFLLILLLSIATGSLRAAESQFQTETVLTYFDTPASSLYTTGNTVYAFQADVSPQAGPGLSFHINGKGLMTQTDGRRHNDISQAELELGYLEYRGDRAGFNARLGRQYIHEGTLVNVIDGMKIQSSLGNYFSASMFGGQPANIYNAGEQIAASTYGGRLTNFSRWHRFSLSYQKFESSETIEEVGGLNLKTNLPAGLTLTGQSYYDMINHIERSRDLRLSFSKRWISPLLRLLKRDTSKQDNSPLAIVAGNNQDFSYLGTELSLPATSRAKLFLNIKNYDYVVEDNSARYYSSRLHWTASTKDYMGAETGFMQSRSRNNNYQIIRLYGHWTPSTNLFPFDNISSEATLINFPHREAGANKSVFMSFRCGKNLFDDQWQMGFSGNVNRAGDQETSLLGLVTLSYRINGNI